MSTTTGPWLRAVLRCSTTLLAATALLAVGSSPAVADPSSVVARDSGTVTISTVPATAGAGATCTVRVTFHGYAQGVGRATVGFAQRSPTTGGSVVVRSGDLTPDIGEDEAGGSADLDGWEEYQLAFTGRAMPLGHRVLVSVTAPGTSGQDSRAKAVWLSGCSAAQPTPTPTGPVAGDPETLPATPDWTNPDWTTPDWTTPTWPPPGPPPADSSEASGASGVLGPSGSLGRSATRSTAPTRSGPAQAAPQRPSTAHRGATRLAAPRALPRTTDESDAVSPAGYRPGPTSSDGFGGSSLVPVIVFLAALVMLGSGVLVRAMSDHQQSSDRDH